MAGRKGSERYCWLSRLPKGRAVNGRVVLEMEMSVTALRGSGSDVVDQSPDKCFRRPDREVEMLVSVPGDVSVELLAERRNVVEKPQRKYPRTMS